MMARTSKDTMKVGETTQIIVSRTESNFDRACDEAAVRAIGVFGINDYGYAENVVDWERSTCSIEVTFEKLSISGDMGGRTYNYIFAATTKFNDDSGN